ncbi:MAG TPA: protein kinase [Enhygromyxa sp.]|nr:protein kinase [Enhygromyxa sp.]
MDHGTSNSAVSADVHGSGDPMASIRPELPASPPLVAATVELSDYGERGEPTIEPSRAHETQSAAPFTISVLEPQAARRDDAPYELLEQIGEGGMGEVWQARQRALGRTVALKRLRDGKRNAQAIVRQFESEARLTGALDHPNIVTVHELGRDQSGRVFYTMKLIQGTAWSELISSNRRKTGDGGVVELELRDHLEILLEVSQAIAFAHSRGVIHRDIKPGNVMIGDYGEVLVVDWGLAVALRPLATLGGAETWTLADLPRAALICGTPAYMSPETATAERERIGPPTDVYLLGAVLFHVLYGRPPHKGKTVQDVISKAKVNGWSFPTTAIPRKHEPWDALLRPVITRALASEPQQRYGDAAAFAEALREALRNYDSAKLATRAQQKLAAMDLHTVTAEGGYKTIAAIIAQLEGALESWPRNLAARRALAQAHLELAALALANDDLALAKLSIHAYEKLPPLPQPTPARRARRVTLHPVDATLVGAPRPSDSLIAAGTSNEWINSVSDAPLPILSGDELARTIGAAELLARRSLARPSGTATKVEPPRTGSFPGASASVDIQQEASETLLDDELRLAERAQRLRDGVKQHEHEARGRRRMVRLALGLAGALALVCIVLLAIGAFAIKHARDQARDERDQLSRVLLDEAANTTEAELEILFKPVHGALLTSVALAQSGQLDVDDPRLLNLHFMPLLGSLDAATSMLRADTLGNEYMLLREQDGWRTRTTVPGIAQQIDLWSEEGEHRESGADERDYNPHTRPWYTGGNLLREQARNARRANNPHPVHWTPPYKFFTTGETGISISAPASSVSGREFVIAFDLKLNDISTFTRELPVGIEQGQVFVLDEQHQVVGFPRETDGLAREQQERLMLTPIANLGEAPVSRAAYFGWRARGYTTEPFRLELGPNQAYWVGFRRVDAVDRPKMWIGVVVPESHFLAE